MDEYEREEQDIQERLDAGVITNEQARIEFRDLQRDYRYAAEEAAEQAYVNELRNW